MAGVRPAEADVSSMDGKITGRGERRLQAIGERALAGSLNDLGRSERFFDVFVETGTCRGDTTRMAAAMFKAVYSIELSEEHFLAAKQRLGGLTNVSLVHGDTAEQLGMLAKSIDRPAVFFLDAHFAGGRTALASTEVPFYDELSAIAQRPQGDLVIIDNLRPFGQSGVSGSEGSEVHPLMQFDWRPISLDRCLDIMRVGRRLIDYLVHDDRVYILRFPHSSLRGATTFPTDILVLRIGHVGPVEASMKLVRGLFNSLKLAILGRTPEWALAHHRKLQDGNDVPNRDAYRSDA